MAVQYIFHFEGKQPQATQIDLGSFEELCAEVERRFPGIKPFDIYYSDEDGDPVKISSDPEFNYATRFATHKNEQLLLLTISEKPGYVEPLKNLLGLACEYFGVGDEEREDVEEFCESIPDGVNVATEKLSQLYVNRKQVASLVSTTLLEGWKDIGKQLSKVSNAKPEPVVEIVEEPEVIVPAAKPVVQPVVVPAVQPVVHNAACNICSKRIEGIRYKCLQCSDYDLCSECESWAVDQNLHTPSHIFVKITKPLPNASVKPIEAQAPAEPAQVEVKPVDSAETIQKLQTLADMGFSSIKRNREVLLQCNGNLEAAIDRLMM